MMMMDDAIMEYTNSLMNNEYHVNFLFYKVIPFFYYSNLLFYYKLKSELLKNELRLILRIIINFADLFIKLVKFNSRIIFFVCNVERFFLNT